jgi:branched-subunit amino acid transport protein
MPWLPVFAVTLANWVMKASGPLVLGDRSLGTTSRRVIALMAPALLAGLIVVDLAGPQWAALDWKQVLGVGAAGAARALRVPMLLAVVCGVVVTALLRQVA